MKIKGTMTISSVQSNTLGRYIAVRFTDESSGVGFVEAKVTFEVFARAVTGEGYVPVELEVRGLELVGMKREHKTVNIELPDDFSALDCDEDALLSHFEYNGWEGRRGDLMNYHKQGKHKSGKRYCSVVFERHVKRQLAGD